MMDLTVLGCPVEYGMYHISIGNPTKYAFLHNLLQILKQNYPTFRQRGKFFFVQSHRLRG